MLAAIEDYLIGDPWGWVHPVQVMGWGINQYTRAIAFYQPLSQEQWQRRLRGIILGLGLIFGSGLIGWLIIWGLTQIHPWLGTAGSAVLLASCFAGKSLRVAVQDVLQPLNAGDIAQARSRLSLYVGRDTQDLAESEILRAILETVAENAVDGVTAPLFYGIIGSLISFGNISLAVPLALAYKAASTLDSMVGYLREPYRDLGWFSARLEDYLTWLPCRLTVLTLGVVSGRPFKVWKICSRDGVKDPSPNSGWSEAAYAGVLQVQLGGKNVYQGVVKEKPLLGNDLETISVAKINHALALTRACFLIWLAIAIAIHY